MLDMDVFIAFVGAAVILCALAVSVLLFVVKDKETTGGDFSGLSWREAFQKLNETMADEYAFTQWKGISWQERARKMVRQILD